MGMILDDLEDHEGYAARRCPTELSRPPGPGTPTAAGAYVAACSCGWTGRHDHPPTERGRNTVEDDWELHHAQPLLATAVPARVRELVNNLHEETAELAGGRPLAARAVAHRLAGWLEHFLQLMASAELRHRLDSLDRGGPAEGLSL